MNVGNAGSDQLLDDVDATPTGIGHDESFSILEGSHDVAVTGRHEVISVNLETSEIPFQQAARPPVVPEAAGHDWLGSIDRSGRWPLVLAVVAAVMAIVFALFISSNSGRGDDDAAAEAVLGRFQSMADDAGPSAGADASDGSVSAGSSGTPDQPGRSTGSSDEFGTDTFFSGQVVEPDEVLTSDATWVTSTLTTDESSSTETSTTGSSTTIGPSTTTASTSTAAPPQAEPWVRAIGPGSTDGQNPTRLAPGQVVLAAEGRGDDIRFRFHLYVWDDDEWDLEDRSRWQSQPQWRIETQRYVGETIRWTVAARDDSRDRAPETEPLYIYTAQRELPPPTDVVNGGFEQVDLGRSPVAVVDDNRMSGWSSSNGVFEVWSSGFEGVNAASGSQFIELNSTSPSAIVQEIRVRPDSVVRWSLQHRSRSGDRERMRVTIGPVDDKGSRTDVSASGNRWIRHEGDYRVPDDVDTVRLVIQSRTGGSVGNLVDDVRVQHLDR